MKLANRSLRFLATGLALTLFAATGCEDEGPEDDPADSIVTTRLTIGTTTIDMRKQDGNITGGPVVIIRGTATPVTAVYLDASGNVVAGLGDFELRITNTALVTFQRTGAFAGTLTGVTAGNTTVTIELFHTVEQHADIGPHNLPITVQ